MTIFMQSALHFTRHPSALPRFHLRDVISFNVDLIHVDLFALCADIKLWRNFLVIASRFKDEEKNCLGKSLSSIILYRSTFLCTCLVYSMNLPLYCSILFFFFELSVLGTSIDVIMTINNVENALSETSPLTLSLPLHSFASREVIP